MFLRSIYLTLRLVVILTCSHVGARSIEWQACSDINSTVPILCGNLSVPLDYTAEDSSARLTLQLVKVLATNGPGQKSILFNFGGPGTPGRIPMAALATELLNYTGGTHDLIAFDTRGTENTIPFLCYDDDLTRALALTAAPRPGRASDTALGAGWAYGELFASTCAAAMNATGALVGTAFVARDMIQIVDALNEDGLLRYWGFSYGTVLGATVAAMFPDRVGGLLLDGVANVFEYYHGYNVAKYIDTDKVFAGFLKACLAAPDSCSLASKDIKTIDLEATLYSLLRQLKYHPFILGSSLIDYTRINGAITSVLYSPEYWPLLATALHGVMTKNLTEVDPLLTLLPTPVNLPYTEYYAGIACSDKTLRASKLSQVHPYIESIFQLSHFSDSETEIITKCAQWKLNAKERYSGNFQTKTKNPIMLIGNTYDPVTPLDSAFNVSNGFEGSVVLQHNGYGHASIAQPSSCTINYIQAYFANGTLPAPGTTCQPDHSPFNSVSNTKRRDLQNGNFRLL